MVEAAFRAHKEIKAKENEAVQPLDNMDKIVRGKMSAYITEQERIRQAEERRLQMEAEEKARKERERLEAQAEKALDKGKVEKAEALIERAEAVYVDPVTVATTVEKTTRLETGGTISTKKDIEVVLPETVDDIRTLCAAIASGTVPHTAVSFSRAVLKAWAKMQGITGKHHGVVFKETSAPIIR